MADNKNNDGKKLTGSFDDVLFSSNSDEKIHSESVQNQQSESSFMADDAFDDVLFEKEPSAKQTNIPATKKPEQKPSDSKATEQTVTKAQKSPQTPKIATDQKPAQTKPEVERDKPSVEVAGIENEALFSSEEDFEQATEITNTEPASSGATKKQTSEVATEALFTTEEAFEQATEITGSSASSSEDSSEPQRQTAEFSKDALFHSESELDKALEGDDDIEEAELEPDLSEALFDSDEDLDKALDAPAAKKPKVEQQKLSVEETEAQKLREAQKHVRDILFTEAMKSNLISMDDHKPSAVNLFATTLNDLQPLDIAEKGIDYTAFDQHLAQQKAMAEEAAKEAEAESDFKQKAKRLLFKARDNLTEKVGADLQERSMALNFAILPQKSKSEVKQLQSRAAMQAALTREGANVHTNTAKLLQQLTALNQCQLPDSERLQMLDLLSPMIFKIAQVLEKHFYKKPYHPSDNNYYATAKYCLELLQLTISAYKQLFAAIYEANNFNYKRQEKTYQTVSAQLFALLIARKKLLLLLNQATDAADTKLLNTVFMAWLLYEQEAVDAKQDIPNLGQFSFSQCFMYYHVLVLFDAAALSKRLHQAFLQHLTVLLPLLKLHNNQVLQFAQASPCLLLLEGRAGLAYSVIDHETPIADVQVVIDVAGFLKAIQSNFEQCHVLVKATDAVFEDRLLTKLPAADAVSLCLFELEQLQAVLANKIRPRFTQYKDAQIDIVLGIEKTHAYLSGKKTIKLRNKAVPIVCQGVWQRLITSNGDVLLKTQHTAKLPWFDIGQLVLLSEELDDEQKQQLLLVEALVIDDGYLLLSLKPVAETMLPVDGDKLGCAILAKASQGSALITAAKLPLSSDDVYEASIFGEQLLLQSADLVYLSKPLQIQLIR